MKIKINLATCFVCTSLLLSSQAVYCQEWKGEELVGKHSYIPSNGFVPDEATAIAVAEAILAPIYGKLSIDGQKPFLVSLENDVWTVSGQLQEQPGRVTLGGVFRIQISKKDGCVKFHSHGK